MRETITNLAGWPIRRSGQPILKSTNEAFLYAQLILTIPKDKPTLFFTGTTPINNLDLNEKRSALIIKP